MYGSFGTLRNMHSVRHLQNPPWSKEFGARSGVTLYVLSKELVDSVAPKGSVSFAFVR